jgi:hypothetical protein
LLGYSGSRRTNEQSLVATVVARRWIYSLRYCSIAFLNALWTANCQYRCAPLSRTSARPQYHLAKFKLDEMYRIETGWLVTESQRRSNAYGAAVDPKEFASTR